MGLLVECPECKRRNSVKAKNCKCGFALAKCSGRVYWIDYLVGGYRKRKRIGPNKTAAEHQLREVLSARTEGRYIRKSPDAKTAFTELAQWYLNLPEVKAKRSYQRDILSVRKLTDHFGSSLLRDITPALVEAFKQKRQNEPSYRGHATKPATINRELSCLKTIFNKAMDNGKAEKTPVKGVKMLSENNERDRVLFPEEYVRLLAHSQDYIRPIIKVAYHTGMRRGEILKLTWRQVDLKEGFIRLRPEDTKTNEGRLVPLNPELMEMFKTMPRGLPDVPVFTRNGKAITCIREAFEAACRKAEIEDFTFHDLRHTFVTNKRREGHHDFVIMKATGHKTTHTFKRYNTISRDDLKGLVAGQSRRG